VSAIPTRIQDERAVLFADFVHPIGDLEHQRVLLVEGGLGIVETLFGLGVGEAFVRLDHGLVDVDLLVTQRLLVEVHLDGVGQPFLLGDERAHRLRENRRQHVNRIGWEIDRVPALDGLGPHGRVGMHVVGDVRDVHPEHELLVAFLDRDGVVEVLGVDRIRRPRGHVSEIPALLEFLVDVGLWVLGQFLGLREDFGWKLVANLELLEELLALVLEVSREILGDFHGALPLGRAGGRLGVVAIGHTPAYEQEGQRRVGSAMCGESTRI